MIDELAFTVFSLGVNAASCSSTDPLPTDDEVIR